MLIPRSSFTGQVRLHSILIRTSDSDTAPATVKVFANRDHVDFETASTLEPIQTIHLSRTNIVQDVPVKRAAFRATRRLSLFFTDNFGDPSRTIIYYLAFKGDFMHLNKEPVKFEYEIAANPADHQKIAGTDGGMSSQLGGGGDGS